MRLTWALPRLPGSTGEVIVKPARLAGAAAFASVAVVIGVAIGGGPKPGRVAAVAFAAVPVVVALVVGMALNRVVVVLVIACQLSGWRIPLGGFRFLPEHVVVIGFAAALLLRSPSTILRRPVAYEVLFLMWILWNAVASLAFSVDVRESLAIVGWLALAWIILWCIRGYFEQSQVDARRALEAGMLAASVLGAVAAVLWVAALAGISTFAVQPEYVTGTLAARGLSFEANLFGSLELFWLFLALRWRVVNDLYIPPLRIFGLVLGIVSSMTRAVWLAAILVVIVAQIGRWDRWRRLPPAPGERPRRRSLQVLVCVLGLAVFVGFGAPAATKFRASLDFRSTTGLERVRNWKVAIDDLGSSSSYLLGRGTNSYGQRHLSRTVAGQPDYLGNLALTILYDTGLVGVMLFGAGLLTFVLHRHVGWGRLFKLLFVAALMIVGAAASPIWFGYVWITLAAVDTVWRPEHLGARQAARILQSRPIDAGRALPVA